MLRLVFGMQIQDGFTGGYAVGIHQGTQMLHMVISAWAQVQWCLLQS
jgi:hypothetical protein